MLYRLFKWLFFLTNKAYFRSIYIKGKSKVPKKGSVIFAANHPSAFMDPILLGVEIKRPLYFLARGDVFKNGLLNRIFNMLHMIPVYKPDQSPDEVHKNELIFEKCFDHLGKQNTIMIFPEGTSKTERRLRPIKTGLARIALGAEERNNYKLGVVIIPIGINYSNPHYFKSDVFVNFGDPISVSDFFSSYQTDQKAGVIALTERVKSELEKSIIIIEDERLDQIIKQIEILYRSKLREEKTSREKGQQDFYLSKDIVEAVEYFARQTPERLEDFEQKITLYLKRLKRLKIRDTQIRTSQITLNLLWQTLYFSIGFPFFLYGLITNFFPFKVAELLSNKIKIREDFVGSVKLGSGLVAFLLLYIGETIIFAQFFDLFWSLIFLVSLYPAGLFTANYFKTYYQFRGTIKYLRIFMKKSNLITDLKSIRQELVNELEQAKKEFLEQREA